MGSAINDLAKLILAQMTQTEEDRRIQANIDACMRGAIADTRRGNPNQLNPAPKAAAPGAGWQEETPMVNHGATPGAKVVDALAEKFVGGPNSVKKD
jgi:hypothetical protein